MTDGDALLAAILAHPAEDTPRLVYADWLQENGDAERAEFIRVQVEIARLCDLQRRDVATADDTARQESLFSRETELAFAVYPRLLHPKYVWLAGLGINPYDCVYNRGGWLAKVRCTAEEWLAHGGAIRAREPLTEVTLTTEPAVRAVAESLLRKEWPGIRFTFDVPERPTITRVVLRPLDGRAVAAHAQTQSRVNSTPFSGFQPRQLQLVRIDAERHPGERWFVEYTGSIESTVTSALTDGSKYSLEVTAGDEVGLLGGAHLFPPAALYAARHAAWSASSRVG